MHTTTNLHTNYPLKTLTYSALPYKTQVVDTQQKSPQRAPFARPETLNQIIRGW